MVVENMPLHGRPVSHFFFFFPVVEEEDKQFIEEKHEAGPAPYITFSSPIIKFPNPDS